MALDYSVHHIGTLLNGNLPPAPTLPQMAGEVSLASDTDSAEIVVASSAILICVPSLKLRLDIRASADKASLDPDASPVVLEADQVRHFTLGVGRWMIKWKAWS